MHIVINPSDPRPIYVQIVDEIRRAVALGALRSEDPLPSVRQLAANVRVNPNTVAQAYRELERAGVAYVRRGQGTFVAPVVANEEQLRALAHAVAERALLEAHRSGLAAEELIEAIREVAASRDISTLAEQS